MSIAVGMGIPGAAAKPSATPATTGAGQDKDEEGEEGTRSTGIRHAYPVLAGLFLFGATATAQAGEPEPGACKLSPPTLARLGYRALPPQLSRADRRALHSAKKALASGDVVSAKKVLEPLAAKHSEAPEVRYLLAAMAASQGAFAEACSGLTWLLELDLPAFGGRIEKDPAFERFRGSADGARLRQHSQALGLLWRQSASEGLPAMMSRGSRGSQEIWSSQTLRGGIYLHATGRFLPFEPGVENAAAVLVHPKAGTVSVVKFRVDDCRSDYCPQLAGIGLSVFRLGEWDSRPSLWRYGAGGAVMADMVDLRSGPRGTHIRVHDCYEGPTCLSPWELVGGRPTPPDRAAEAEMSLAVGYRGSLLGVAPADQQIRRGRLVAGKTEIQLDAQHRDATAVHDILVNRATGDRLVLSTVDRCECSSKREGPILRYVLSRVTAQGSAAVVLSGKGPAAALLDGKDAFYLQTGEIVQRWDTMAVVGTRPGTPVMSGVVLVVPVSERGNCCGL